MSPPKKNNSVPNKENHISKISKGGKVSSNLDQCAVKSIKNNLIISGIKKMFKSLEFIYIECLISHIMFLSEGKFYF